MARKLFVGNLPWEVRSRQLGEILRERGIRHELAEVLEDRDTGRSRGFGFVHFASDEDGDAALPMMQDLEVGGRRLRVDEATKMNKQRQRSRSGAGRGRRYYSGERSDDDWDE